MKFCGFFCNYIVDVDLILTVMNEAHVVCVQRQRTAGRRQRNDDSCFFSDAASETSSVCSETSFRTGSEISDVRFTCLLLSTGICFQYLYSVPCIPYARQFFISLCCPESYPISIYARMYVSNVQVL